MARLDQSLNGDGKAYQAGQDVTVYEGYSATEVGDLLVKLASQLMTLTQGAGQTANNRLDEFKDALIEGLAKPGNEANTQAFADPDYQYAVHTAQKAYVRDGSEKLRNELVGLLIQRSKVDSTDRVAKILNQALETAGNLSKSEYAALAVHFLFTNVRVGSASQSKLFEKFSRYIAPFVGDLTDNVSCYEYLESQRCVSLNAIMTRDLRLSLYESYGSLLGPGLDESSILAIETPKGSNSWSGLVGRNGNTTKPFFFLESNVKDFQSKIVERDFSEGAVSKALELFNSSMPSQDEVVARFDAEITGFAHILDTWSKSHLQQMTLTAVGKVIAHSAQTGKTDFDAPLSIWVS